MTPTELRAQYDDDTRVRSLCASILMFTSLYFAATSVPTSLEPADTITSALGWVLAVLVGVMAWTVRRPKGWTPPDASTAGAVSKEAAEAAKRLEGATMMAEALGGMRSQLIIQGFNETVAEHLVLAAVSRGAGDEQ